METEKTYFYKWLRPDSDDRVMERLNALSWFDKNGIYCSVPIPGKAVPTLQEMKDNIEWWEREFAGQKVWWLTVVDPNAKGSKESRDFMKDILPRYVHGLALINHSALGRMAANIFFGLHSPTYPVKMFSDSTSAKEWLIAQKSLHHVESR
ncbi:MAG TPA: hypothetical protein VFV37_09330 [Luteibaculaceae bacterium]|nr:hypothetical protein [Luteibaculaceae bacterium]